MPGRAETYHENTKSRKHETSDPETSGQLPQSVTEAINEIHPFAFRAFQLSCYRDSKRVSIDLIFPFHVRRGH